jgi:hypothetical protein
VHWTILGHALPRLDIDPRYDSPTTTATVWACGLLPFASTKAFSIFISQLPPKAFSS